MQGIILNVWLVVFRKPIFLSLIYMAFENINEYLLCILVLLRVFLLICLMSSNVASSLLVSSYMHVILAHNINEI